MNFEAILLEKTSEWGPHRSSTADGPLTSNSRLRLKARKLGVGAPEFLRFANL